MLIYDYNKKFVGIDDDDLKHLGFNNANGLFDLCDDFADLFVKRPGYIHNFKNFEWIDFVMHADAEVAKAIIHTPTRNYSCKLQIKPFYFVGSQGKEGYQIYLQGLKPLNSEEDAQIAPDLKMHSIPSIAPKSAPYSVQPEPEKSTFISDINLPDFGNTPAMELSEPDIFDVPVSESVSLAFEEPTRPLEEPKPLKLDIGDIFIPNGIQPEFEFSDEFTPPPGIDIPTPEPLIEVPPKRSNLPDIPMLGDKLSAADRLFIDNLHVTSDYRYNPNIAAQELGLPVDLIEEFIGDFIQQSHDFYQPLFNALEQHDIDSIKTLSHKLKGVAANLRIEDSFEVLSIINTSKDFDEISANLKYFYHLISKLEGKEMPKDLADASSLSDPIVAHEDGSLHVTPQREHEGLEYAPFDIASESLFETKTAPLGLEPYEPSYDNIQIKSPSFDAVAASPMPSFQYDEPMIDIKQSNDEHEPLLILEPSIEQMQEEPVLRDTLQESSPIVPETAPSTFAIALEIDTQKTAQEIGLPYDVVNELMGEFKSDALRTEFLIQEAVAAFEPQSWQKPARLLKGISDNLRLEQISKELQMLSQTNDAQKAKTALQNYSGLIAQL